MYTTSFLNKTMFVEIFTKVKINVKKIRFTRDTLCVDFLIVKFV